MLDWNAERADVPAREEEASPDPIAVRRPWFDSLTLDSPALTVCYWTTALLFVLAFWACALPPLVDYPQHVAIGALLRRMLDPHSPERQLYDVNLVTYNGGFHVLVAALSLVMSPEAAGKTLLSVYPLSFAYAALALVRVAERPRWYALFVLPITYSFAVGWGFANFFISVPFAILAFTFWLRGHRGEKGMLWRVMLLSALLSYAHVLATLCLCITIGVASLREFQSPTARTKHSGVIALLGVVVCFAPLFVFWPEVRRLAFASPVRMLLVLGVLATVPVGIGRGMRVLSESMRSRLYGLSGVPFWVSPAVLWSLIVFAHNRASPHANWEGWDDGRDDPLWFKLLHLTSYAVGNFGDRSDQVLLALAVALLIVLWKWESRPGSSEPLMRTLASLWAVLYCVIPKVFIATWFIFERFPTFVLAFGVAATPAVRGTSALFFRRAAAVLALAAGFNTVWHLSHVPDERDADAILDDIPEGRRVIAVTWSNHGDPVVLREMWVHYLAYYQARRPGLIAYSFAKFESMPVHYRLGLRPPGIPGGMEWDARKYDATQPWARYWDTVLVRTPDESPSEDPRARTFGEAAPWVRVLSKRGRFWLLDASELDAAPVPSEDES